jgi:hypothetical protein
MENIKPIELVYVHGDANIDPVTTDNKYVSTTMDVIITRFNFALAYGDFEITCDNSSNSNWSNFKRKIYDTTNIFNHRSLQLKLELYNKVFKPELKSLLEDYDLSGMFTNIVRIIDFDSFNITIVNVADDYVTLRFNTRVIAKEY